MNIFGKKKKKTVNIKEGDDKGHQSKGNVTQVYNIKKLRFMGKVEEKLEDAFGDEDPPELDYDAIDAASDKAEYLKSVLGAMAEDARKDFIDWFVEAWGPVRDDVMGTKK